MALLGDILKGITQPFRGTADLVGSALGSIVSGYDPKLASRIAGGLTNTPLGLSSQEAANVYTDNPLALFKPAAGVAAYAVPGAGAGGSVARAAALGAGAGALGGFGASQAGGELGGTLGGAALGGVLGGGLQYGGNLLKSRGAAKGIQDAAKGPSKLGEAGRVGQARGMGLYDEGISQAKNLENLTLFEDAIEAGGSKVGLTPTQNLAAADEALTNLRSTKLKVLGELQIPVQTPNDIADDILGTWRKSVPLKNATKPVERHMKTVVDSIAELGAAPTATQLDDLAGAFQKQVNFARAGKKNATEEVYKLAAEAIRKNIDKVDPTDIVKGANKGISGLLGLTKERGGILAQSARGVQKDVGLGALVGGVKAPVRLQPAASAARTLGGRAAEGISKGVSGLAGIGQKVAPIAQKAGGVAARYAPAAMPGILGALGQAQPTSVAGGEMPDVLYEQQPAQEQQALSFMDAMGLAQQYFPQGSESELMSLASKLVAESQTGSGEVSPQQAASAAVGQLRVLFGRGDPGAVGTEGDLALGGEGGALGRIGGGIAGAYKDVFDPEYASDLQIFNNQVNQLMGLFTQALGSGAPQEAEAKRLIDSIPGPGTPDPVAKAWFDQMEQLLGSVSGGMNVSPEETSGFMY